MAELPIYPDGSKLPDAVRELAAQISADGGAALAAYQEPVGDHWHLFAMIPTAKLEPTPFQRDLSPAHMKRLNEVMKKLKRFTEPIVVVRAGDGYWTPNGNHRRAAVTKLGAKMIPAIVMAEPEVAYQILALNTEKAHNLKDKALEVIRMYRGRLESQPRANEKDFDFEFEKAAFITLGLCYEANKKFSGGAYSAILTRVDTFINKPLREAMEEREERAAEVQRADELVNELVAKGKKRGLMHPYLKNFIIARCNPLTRVRKTMPTYKAALASLVKSLEEFDLAKIHFGQVREAATIAAAVSSEPG
jgi:ParB family transcriptional regulator, chromosome partitioning protein